LFAVALPACRQAEPTKRAPSSRFGARPQREVTSRHNAGCGANENLDGLISNGRVSQPLTPDFTVNDGIDIAAGGRHRYPWPAHTGPWRHPNPEYTTVTLKVQLPHCDKSHLPVTVSGVLLGSRHTLLLRTSSFEVGPRFDTVVAEMRPWFMLASTSIGA